MRISTNFAGRYFLALVLIISGMSAVFSPGCATTPETAAEIDTGAAQKKYREALQYQSLNMRVEMIASLKEAVRLDPNQPTYRLQLGKAYFLNGEFEPAERELLQTIEINDQYHDAYKLLGRLYMAQGKWSQAITYFNKILQQPGTVRPIHVYNWLALSYYKSGQFDQAEVHWLKALDIQENAGVRLNLALAYRDRERFEQAIASLKKAIALNPKFVQANYEIALLYIKKNKMNEAIKHFEQVTKTAPQSKWAESSREYLGLIRSGN